MPHRRAVFLTLLVRPSSGIRTPADLRGKSIGVAPTPIVKLVTRLWLTRNGVDPDSVTFVSVTPMIAMGAALKNSSVDAVVDGDPFTEQLVKQYGFVALGYPSREEPLDATVKRLHCNDGLAALPPRRCEGFRGCHSRGERAGPMRLRRKKRPLCLQSSRRSISHRSKLRFRGLRDSFTTSGGPTARSTSAPTQRWLDLSLKSGALDKRLVLEPYLCRSRSIGRSTEHDARQGADRASRGTECHDSKHAGACDVE